jgi:hypothetical protein
MVPPPALPLFKIPRADATYLSKEDGDELATATQMEDLKTQLTAALDDIAALADELEDGTLVHCDALHVPRFGVCWLSRVGCRSA